MKAFLGIRPEDTVIDRFEEAADAFEDIEHVGLQPRSNYHVTVKFLGQIEGIDTTVSAVEPVVAEHDSFNLAFYGPVVRTPHEGVHRIYAEIDDGQDALESLVADIDAALQPYGFDPWEDYTPHATMGVVKDETSLHEAEETAEVYGEQAFGTSTVEEILLYESIPAEEDGRPPTYRQVDHFPLGDT